MTMSKKNVISLFSGCGGGDLGVLGDFKYLGKHYKRHNFNIIHASDICSKAINTYTANFGAESAQIMDVRELNLKDTNADLIVGGFPCQPFSTVNPLKEPHKKESQLFWEMARIVSNVKPKVFVAENVKGFYRLKNGYYFNLACEEFSSLGYKIYHKLLNSSDYGIPQKRERIFIVGVREDINIPFFFPEATHGVVKGLKERVQLKEIIKSLYPDDTKYFFSQRAVDGVKRAKPNMKRALAQNLEEQCLTITSHLAKVSMNSRDPILLVDKDKELYRRFTPREAASIQSFPLTFEFKGSQGDAYKQIGNAIPPVMMWHIAHAVALLLSEVDALGISK